MEGSDDETGPNDGGDVVFESLISFFFFFHVSLILIVIYICVHLIYFKVKGRRLKEGSDDEDGINDASGVVWALDSKFFLCFINTNCYV